MKQTHDHKTGDLFNGERITICKECEAFYLRQRTQSHRTIAKWQREYFAMKSERDHLAQLLRLHREAQQQLANETYAKAGRRADQ